MTAEIVEEPPRCRTRCMRVTRKGICDRCYDLTARDLAALPGLYVELRIRLAPSQGGGGAPVSGSKERPLAVRVEPLDHMRLIVDQLRAWSRIVIDERRLVGPRTPPVRRAGRIVVGGHGEAERDRCPDRDQYATQVVTLVEFLHTHHEWSSRQLWADDYSEEIRELAHNARRLAGLYDQRPQLKEGVPCPRCDFMSLEVAPGADDVTCNNPDCSAVLRPEEYRTHLKTLVTAGRIAV
jgi:hypothetical protein